ncbi:hypothetical protein EDM56_26280 [Brevibacillus fluminis]|uniref:Uncharacterized protein n=1 Tax=Brevibacillus fluminis TaxID=511487 RepID=A0A3M8D017_9BACL|nr:hypothetical protein EDM56_26280 [Brevibacillus fluminis]
MEPSKRSNWMDGIAQYMNRTPSKDNLETSSWACYQYGKSMTATEYLEARPWKNKRPSIHVQSIREALG